MIRCKIVSLIFVLILVSNTIMAQESTYMKPALSNSDSWTLILLPDPQTYVKFERNQGVLELITGWISENIDELNIKMVLCTGDLVEQNNILIADNVNGNQSSRKQWEAISKAFNRLDGKVPYILAAGNHDFGYKNIENRDSYYNKYFPAARNLLNQRILKEVTNGIDNKPTLANAAFEFVSPHNRKFLFVNLEFAPRDAVVQWAKTVTDKNIYQDHTAVVLTHSYLNAQNERIAHEGYPISDGNYGEALWNKLIKPSMNIQLVVSGHIGAANNFKGHVGFRTDKNDGEKNVSQMVFNAQAMGGGWHGNGGDGWLRILEFMPDGNTVMVKTFSPLFAISKITQSMAWSRDSFNEFTFTID